MNISPALKKAIREGRAVLFLGAGATIGAESADGSSPPTGPQLAKMLSDQFLGGEDSELPLSVVAEYSISETDLVTVQEFIRDIFAKYRPADFHRLIPTFKWAGVATTNYDLIVERAYDACAEKVQDLVPFLKNTDRVDRKLRTENTVPYLKLHGCISRCNEIDIPLILTIDQYVTYRTNRSKLFERLRDYGADYPMVFVGHRLEDPDLRHVLLELAQADTSRPRYYVVTPNPSERQIRFWETKKITAIPGTLKNFLETLNGEIDPALRAISLPEREHEIAKRFVTRDQQLSNETLSILKTDATYITQHLATTNTKAIEFYKGYSFGWDAIQKGYDAKRNLEDTVLSDVILVDDVDRPSIADMYLIRGHAGSGKSVILKRIAWEAANEFGKLCIYWNGAAPIDAGSIFEIMDNVDERAYVFIDGASDHSRDILRLISTAKRKRYRLTLILAERSNEWNITCECLDALISEIYDVRYLSRDETLRLLSKLEENKALGMLQNLPEEERLAAFEKKAGRQLLVALHEATLGKPFEDIICDEFGNIQPEEARRIYQTVCVLNRLNVPVRAGIIRRVHGVSFDQFKERFFGPLESVVYARKYEGTVDMAYTARHPWIAETVFERTLPDPSERMDLYLRLLGAIDIGYEADWKAYRNLIKARELLRLFPDPKMVRVIYDCAGSVGTSDAYFHQQKAIYEMRRDNPNLDLAYEELKVAEHLSPKDQSITHSLAELELVRAQRASTEIEANRHRDAAAGIARALTGNRAETSFGYHTLCKIALEKLKTQLRDDPDNEVHVSTLIRNAEQQIKEALERFPDDEYLLEAESQLATHVSADDRAVRALERAFSVNSLSPFIARSLARLHEVRGEPVKARQVLGKCLEGLPGDKSVNGALARLITKHAPDESQRAEYYWRRSFTEGDTNHASQFWYARQLYLNGKRDEAKVFFKALRDARVAPSVKQKIRGPILGEDGRPARVKGHVEKLEASYAFLSQELDTDWAFLHRTNVSSKVWNGLSRGKPILFSIGFTYRGLGAFDVSLASED